MLVDVKLVKRAGFVTLLAVLHTKMEAQLTPHFRATKVEEGDPRRETDSRYPTHSDFHPRSGQ